MTGIQPLVIASLLDNVMF